MAAKLKITQLCTRHMPKGSYSTSNWAPWWKGILFTGTGDLNRVSTNVERTIKIRGGKVFA